MKNVTSKCSCSSAQLNTYSIGTLPCANLLKMLHLTFFLFNFAALTSPDNMNPALMAKETTQLMQYLWLFFIGASFYAN